MNIVIILFTLYLIFFSIKVVHANHINLHDTDYIYKSEVCQSAGNRLGELINLATLAKIDNVNIHYQWCNEEDKGAQRFYHDDKNMSMDEFLKRFSMPQELHIRQTFTRQHHDHQYRVKYEGLEIPSALGFNYMYTTAHRTTKVKNDMVDKNEYLKAYRDVSRPIVEIAVKKHQIERPYIVLHMNEVNEKVHKPMHGIYDHFKTFCTLDVLKEIKSKLKNKNIIGLSNNISWMQNMLGENHDIHIIDVSDYDKMQYIMSANAVVQHSIYGWSALSSVPALMAQIPLLTTYSPKMHLHRYNLVKKFGSIPTEFYDCTQMNNFIKDVMWKWHKSK